MKEREKERAGTFLTSLSGEADHFDLQVVRGVEREIFSSSTTRRREKEREGGILMCWRKGGFRKDLPRSDDGGAVLSFGCEETERGTRNPNARALEEKTSNRFCPKQGICTALSMRL